MALPIRVVYEDVTVIVDYLRTKAAGVPLSEARAVVAEKHLDGRKLSALVTWGLITRDGDAIKLTAEGREFARLDPAGRAKHVGVIIARTTIYRTVIEWLFHSKMATVTNVEVAAHWLDLNKADLETKNENTLKDAGIVFFHMAQAAGLGKLTLGRHGKPTRFDADLEAIGRFIESPPETGKPAPEVKPEHRPDEEEEDHEEAPPVPRQIFVAHGKNRQPVESLKKILDQFKVPYKIAVDEPHAGRPISKKVADLMHDCTSAIFVFTGDEESFDAKGNKTLKPSDNVVYELGAATVLYDGKVVIFREEGVEFASDFKDFGYITFESGKIEAKAMDLLKELVGFGLLKVTPA